MPTIRVKAFAAKTHRELEKEMNSWLADEPGKVIDVDFVADGLDLSYNCLVLYQQAADKPRKTRSVRKLLSTTE